MEHISRTIIGKAIEQQKERGPQQVDQFTDGVQKQVEKNTAALQATYGDGMKQIAGEAMKEAKTYAQARNEVYAGFTAEDLRAESADGVANMQTREVAVDAHYMDLQETDAEEAKVQEHGAKVVKHEEQHRDHQAAAYDLDTIVLDPTQNKQVTAKDLYEGDAIAAAGQAAHELTADYQIHQQMHNEVVRIAGEDTVRDALETGRLTELQDRIIDVQRDHFANVLTDNVGQQQTLAA